MYKIYLVSEHGDGVYGAGISFFHLNSYFLTGVMSNWDTINNDTVFAFTDIKYHVSWIRGLLNKHVSKQYIYFIGINLNFKILFSLFFLNIFCFIMAYFKKDKYF